jgi:hypothetical protein
MDGNFFTLWSAYNCYGDSLCNCCEDASKKSVKDLADLLGCLDTALTDDKIDAVELKEIYTRAKTLGQDLKPILQNLSTSKSQNKK